MDIERILQEEDELFLNFQAEKVEGFLEEKISEAAAMGDSGAVVTLMNELIGYLREASKYEKSLYYCDEVLKLLQAMGMEESLAYATTLLNVANAYRAAGKLSESMALYEQVLERYEGVVAPEDMRYASLYNNLSLLYQEMEDFGKACYYLEKALPIVELYPEARIELATTHTNLGASKLKLGQIIQAKESIERAIALFKMDERKDLHYSAALNAMAEVMYRQGRIEEAIKYYKEALREIEKHNGKNHAYEITLHNLNELQKEENKYPSVEKKYKKGMELCEDFYLDYGIPMIREKFPQYENMIAVGLVGEGSECFRFDDEVSRDHDFGPGFCMWLTDSVYDEIGEALQTEYDKLPKTYMGITRLTTKKASKRVGVFRIKDFYSQLIGLEDIPETQNQWLFVEDYQLASAVNGKVFRDDIGEFSRVRSGLLKHYPEEVRVKKIAREAALMAQSGQYNYLRMFGRGEQVTALIALSEFMKHTMGMVYLLNRVYAPFYKWMHKGMSGLPILPLIPGLLDKLSRMPIGDERIPETIEFIVSMIIAEMKKQGLTSENDNYLDHHTDSILKSIETSEKENPMKQALVEELVRLEWEAFDKVENEGGRASCQNDFGTFSIMRKSQYLTWSEPLLYSYIRDFKEANASGWNLITEKYGRMMESTDSEGYIGIRDSLPKMSAEKKAIIEEIVKIQVVWMEEFAITYPKSAGNARSIHTTEDSLYNTSYETYLRGEISTYSDETLELYGRFIVGLYNQGKNLAKLTFLNTAKLYGYGSLEEMEEKI